MNSEKLKEYSDKYKEDLFPKFQIYSSTLECILKSIANDTDPLAFVSARPKSLESFIEKINRKGYEEPFKQMTDMCGARIVAHTIDQIDQIREIIEREFIIDQKNYVDAIERLSKNEFGYLSVHYIVQLKAGTILGIVVPNDILPNDEIPFKAEIQVRTLKLKDYLDQYKDLFPKFQIYSSTLECILKSIANDTDPLAFVSARPKSLASFIEKINRKGYEEPFKQMTDMCGARIVAHTIDQIDQIKEIIEREFIIDQKNYVDAIERLSKNEFGYLSIHYIVQLKAGTILGIVVPDDILPNDEIPFKAEIQVRTLLQHTWADTFHDRLYKNNIKKPKSLERDVARVAAILEEADNLISKETSMIDDFIVDIGAYLSKKEIEKEIDILKNVFSLDEDVKNKQNLALRISKLYRAIFEWDHIIDFLNKTNIYQSNPKLLAELGNAYCENYSLTPNDDNYDKGIKLLNESIDSNNSDPLSLSLLAQAYIRKRGENDKTKMHFKRAFELNPKNPYYFSNYLVFELSHSSFLLQPFINLAIDTCQQHIEARIELPQAYLTIGRLSLLLLNDIYTNDNKDRIEKVKMEHFINQIIENYALAIKMYLEMDSCICSSVINNEIIFIKEIKGKLSSLRNDPKKILESILFMLIIANYLKNKECPKCQVDNIELNKMKPENELPYEENKKILFVVGGCSKDISSDIKHYKPVLENILKHFNGIVIGGGTTSGISGMLGEIASKTINDRKYILLGYHPSRLGTDYTVDRDNYDVLVKTKSEDNCLFDSLQAWIDILASNIPIENIRILAINGGNITLQECFVGISFGSLTGVVKGSGRSADIILSNPRWSKMDNIIPLIDEDMTINAFVNQGQSKLNVELIDSISKCAHEKFIEHCGSEKYEKSYRPWEDLSDYYKEANRRQIRYAEVILKANGYQMVEIGDEKQVKVYSFTDDDSKRVEEMSKMEHGRWVLSKIMDKWVEGKPRDDSKKIHPDITGWDNLDQNTKNKDINAVKSWPEIFAKAGIEIRR